MSAAHPAVHSERWTTQRKAAVIEAILSDTLPLEEAFERYALSPEELGEWWRAYSSTQPIS